MKNYKELCGKVAIVTGAASGIGLSITQDLNAAGVRIIAADLNVEKLAASFPKDVYEHVVIVPANVSSGADRKKILQTAIDLGGPDFLVNAAGIVRTKEIFEVTEEIWDQIQDVNAKSCFFMCQAVGQYWVKKQKTGAIVNFSSSAGKTASNTLIAPYSASKASVIAITKAFANALASSGCRVNCVCPGLINTPMQEILKRELSNSLGAPEENVENMRLSMVPLGREGTPEEVSKVVQFLLSDSSAYMTGQSINITGGMVMY
jgi:NAD(P)-dependent dehydrogenase (short-subunit alcohol dehydrogenase family)